MPQFISKGITLWLVVSSIIVFFDAAYVLLRPLSMRGGQYFWLFKPYEIYIQYDTLYALNKDTFVVIQSWLNIVEAIFALLAVILSFSSGAATRLRSALLAIVISAFVFWKTVIFLIYDKDFITPAVKNLETNAILFYVIPSSLWIIFPLLTIYKVSKRIIKQSIEAGKGKKE